MLLHSPYIHNYVCSYIPLCDIDLKQTMPYRLQLMACIKFCTYIYCIYIGTLFAVLSMLALHIPPACMQEMSKMSLSKGCPWPLGTWPMECSLVPKGGWSYSGSLYIHSYRLNSSLALLRAVFCSYSFIISYRKPCFTYSHMNLTQTV